MIQIMFQQIKSTKVRGTTDSKRERQGTERTDQDHIIRSHVSELSLETVLRMLRKKPKRQKKIRRRSLRKIPRLMSPLSLTRTRALNLKMRLHLLLKALRRAILSAPESQRSKPAMTKKQ